MLRHIAHRHSESSQSSCDGDAPSSILTWRVHYGWLLRPWPFAGDTATPACQDARRNVSNPSATRAWMHGMRSSHGAGWLQSPRARLDVRLSVVRSAHHHTRPWPHLMYGPGMLQQRPRPVRPWLLQPCRVTALKNVVTATAAICPFAVPLPAPERQNFRTAGRKKIPRGKSDIQHADIKKYFFVAHRLQNAQQLSNHQEVPHVFGY